MCLSKFRRTHGCALTPMLTYLKSERGVTLIEVLVSIFLVALVVIGTMQLFVFGRVQINYQGHKSAAVGLVQQRLEELLASSCYDSVLAKTENNLSLDNLLYTRTTTVEAVDDSADGLGAADTDDTDDYRKVTVTVSWNESGKTDSVALQTLVAP